MAITSEELKTSVAAYVLKGESDELIDAWDVIIPDALETAYQELLAILVNRGYTKAQVDAWDGLNAYWRRLATYYAITLGSGLVQNYDDKWVEKLKPDLKFLETAQISIGGVQATPDDEADGMVLQGDLDTEDDRYTKDMEL